MSDANQQAQQLADLFTHLADEVNSFRNAHFDDLTPQQRQDLEDKIQQLYDFHDQFAGAVIEGAINAMQGDLGQLTKVTNEANATLKHLESIATVVKLVAAASTLAETIVTGDFGAIPEAVRALAQTIIDSSDKQST